MVHFSPPVKPDVHPPFQLFISSEKRDLGGVLLSRFEVLVIDLDQFLLGLNDLNIYEGLSAAKSKLVRLTII